MDKVLNKKKLLANEIDGFLSKFGLLDGELVRFDIILRIEEVDKDLQWIAENLRLDDD